MMRRTYRRPNAFQSWNVRRHAAMIAWAILSAALASGFVAIVWASLSLAADLADRY